MTGWRLAASLIQLRKEVDGRWKVRDHHSDGSIGDDSHGDRSSDHNPWVKDSKGIGVVRALDIDAGPGLRPDEAHDGLGDTLAELLRKAGKNNHPALKYGGYVIYEKRITSAKSSWEWRPYRGVDPHESHVHVSVGTRATAYDATGPWKVALPPVRFHIVKSGDTLSELPVKYRVTGADIDAKVRKIKVANGLHTNLIMVGQRLRIPR